jgi:hypothetical protein
MSTSNRPKALSTKDGGSIRGTQLYALRQLQLPPYVDRYGDKVSGAALKAVLRTIDDHGASCWASTATIARETCLNEKTVRRSIKALSALGLLAVVSKIGQSSDCKINWDAFTTPDTMSEVEQVTTPDTMSMTSDTMSTTPDSMSTDPGHRVQQSDMKRKGNDKKRDTKSQLRFDDQDLSFAKLMFEMIKSVAPKTKQPDLNNWANTIRMMRELDGHSLDEISAVFTWANGDDFWKAQILSPDNLRKKFATLHARMVNPISFGKPRSVNRSSGVDYDSTRKTKNEF